MGMPITVEIVDPAVTQKHLDAVFAYFTSIEERFSVFKDTSEITKINKGQQIISKASADMKKIFRLCEETKQATQGYFDIVARDGSLNPSGIVKGWSIYQASELLKKNGMHHYYVEAGGDIQVSGSNADNKPWSIGIRNPFKHEEIVKIVYLVHQGIATSGTYLRGQHIYNPHDKTEVFSEVVSLSVIGPNIYEADRFATAAFAMGRKGIEFIEQLPGFEGYAIDKNGIATMTSNFDTYTKSYV